MGRHRPDPRGHARILIAIAAIVLALALLIVGGLALFGALTNQSSPAAGPSQSTTAKPSRSGGDTSTAPSPTGTYALFIRVTGPSAAVYVATPGNAQTLYRGTLNSGEVRYFDEPELIVVVDPAQNVEVKIHGRSVSSGRTGKQSWQVNPA